MLEKPIGHRGNLIALPRRNFFFLHLGIFPSKRCYPGNLGDDTLQGRATKILDEFPAGEE
jgi:hypothetical protein